MSTQQIAQSGRYTYKLRSVYYLRISTLPLSIGSESCVIRIVPQYFQNKKETYEFNDFKHLMNKKQGLLLLQDQLVQVKHTHVSNGYVRAKRIESQCHIYRRPRRTNFKRYYSNLSEY